MTVVSILFLFNIEFIKVVIGYVIYVYNKLGKYTANAVTMVNRTNLKGKWSGFSDYVDPTPWSETGNQDKNDPKVVKLLIRRRMSNKKAPDGECLGLDLAAAELILFHQDDFSCCHKSCTTFCHWSCSHNRIVDS